MKRKYILAVLAVLICIILLIVLNNHIGWMEKFTGTSTLHTIFPSGTYKDKCKQIFYDGYRLFALCPNTNGVYVNTRFCTCECPCVDKTATIELNCGCLTNKFGVNDNGQLICEK